MISTLVGAGLDTLIFVVVAFAGVLPAGLLWSIILSNYIFKVGFEIAATPLNPSHREPTQVRREPRRLRRGDQLQAVPARRVGMSIAVDPRGS